jgi:transposase InsO family protein
MPAPSQTVSNLWKGDGASDSNKGADLLRGPVPKVNTNWFLSLDEARRKCEAWRRDYNEVRPHNAIDNQVPAALHRTAGKPGQPAAR